MPVGDFFPESPDELEVTTEREISDTRSDEILADAELQTTAGSPVLLLRQLLQWNRYGTPTVLRCKTKYSVPLGSESTLPLRHTLQHSCLSNGRFCTKWKPHEHRV